MSDLNISIEGIDAQHDSMLVHDLRVALTTVRKQSRVNQTVIRSTGISKIIAKHTGLDIQVRVVEGLNAYVLPPEVNKNNPIYENASRWFRTNSESDALMEHSDVISGTVDLKRSRVTGDFTKISTYMGIGESLLYKGSKFSIDETLAIMMHEIGHVFVSLELTARATSTNYLMVEVSRRLLNADTKEQRIDILKDTEKALGTTIDDKDKISEQKRSNATYRTIVLSAASKEIKSQWGENIYDLRSFEQLADQFAVRHGLGRALATGLDKVMRAVGYVEYRHPATFAFFKALEVSLAIFILAFGNAFHIGLCIFALIMFRPMDEIYDKPRDRLGKMRQEMIGSLKDRSLDKKLRKSILKDIDVIENLEKDIIQYNDIIEFVWRNVLPWGRKEQCDINTQMKLERLANNKLYAASAQLA